LEGELPGVSAFGDAVNFLEDDLTDRHALFEADLQRADVPDLKSDLRTGEGGIVEDLTEARVDDGGQ
jgi:hypothetical protein